MQPSSVSSARAFPSARVLLASVFVLLGGQGCRGCTSEAPPACNAPRTCPVETVRVCGSKCVKPVPLGQPCSLDPCADNGWCASNGSCAADARDGRLKCTSLGYNFGSKCDPKGSERCPNDMFCLDSACTGQPASKCTLAFFALEALCDSNFTAPKCSPCPPGYLCEGGRCRVPCERAEECPCDERDHTASSYECKALPGGRPYCYHCKTFGEVCDPSLFPCCDGSTCPGANGRCCMGIGSPMKCSSRGDCCAGGGCFAGKCQTCRAKAAACGSDDECCAGLQCREGICKPHCPGEGTPCSVPNAKGSCAAGKWDCKSQADPICTQVVVPKPDTTCNNQDEDCDGKVDDDYVGAACVMTVSGCQASLKFVRSKQCKAGIEMCPAPVAGTDYCNASDNSNRCGFSSFNACRPGLDFCTPGFVCKAGNTVGCPPQDNRTACWPSSAANMCVPCGQNICWLPNTPNVQGTCPAP